VTVWNFVSYTTGLRTTTSAILPAFGDMRLRRGIWRTRIWSVGSTVVVSGVILDSGGVLIRPMTGEWFPPRAFHEVMGTRGLAWDPDRLDDALALAGRYLNDIHSTALADEAAERPVWVQYYRILLEQLGVAADHCELAETITLATESSIGAEPFSWTEPVLRELHCRGVPLVVLSDAWPSLRRWFRELSLDRYVRAMVISGEEGITKPDRRVFEKARGLLGSGVNDVVFVDDWPGNVRAASQLGMRGLRLRHASEEREDGVEEISDLTELLTLL
jgi:putative hydrolase of the HAD superfamily